MNVKTGDKVLVLTGKDKGKVGTVLESFPKDKRVTVKGVNVLTKHRKPRSQQDKGGITKMEGKIEVSNVQVVCPACGKATRVAHKLDEKGNKIRVCKKCGANILTAKVKKPAKVKEAKADETKVEKAAPKATAAKQPVKNVVAKDTTKATKSATAASSAKKSSPTRKTAGK